MLEIRILGPLNVRDGERDLTPRRQKHRALLAALALRAGEIVSADRLVDDLWGERAPKTAKHALENYVSELRKLLGRDLIETTASGYVLRIDPGQVDTARFERLVADARGREPAQQAELLGDALRLIRGEALDDLAFEPFAQAEIARLQAVELSAREEHVQAELELGHHAAVVAVLESLVKAHPFRERFRAQLMLALYRSGRQAEALAAYRAARGALLDELGIDPGQELQELERAILRHDPELRAPAPTTEPTDDPSSAPIASSPRRPGRKNVTTLVVGLANYAALGERLDPEPLRALLDRFAVVARTAVERHGGTCGRVAGGEILAVFGIPSAHEDDALRAVRAAVDVRAGIGVLNDGLLPEHGLFLEARIAVTTGEALVAADSADPATGRAVASAELLERQAAAGQILLDQHTHQLVRAAVEVAEMPATELGDGSPEAVRLVDLVAGHEGRVLRLDSPIVGRRRQLAVLSGAFEAVVADRSCHLVTVLGAAGVGKSRLVREFVEGVAEVATVFHGRCLPYGEEVTFWPLREALAATGLSLADVEADPVREQIENLARIRPLTLVFDDLQWAEPAFLDLVERVVESSRDAPILVVCIARPELLDERPTWGGRKPRASSLLLEPLNEVESDRLIDNLLGESDLPEPVRDYVVTRAEGNPLFLEELLTTLVERDVLYRKAGRWTTTELPAIPLPPSIQALVTARIDRLPEGERIVLDLASVAGKAFPLDLVAELAAEEARNEVEAHVDELVRRELVRPQGDRVFAFRHQVIRDVAYASVSMQQRAELHERIAGWLERTSDAQPADRGEIVRYHLDQSHRYRARLAQAGGDTAEGG